MKLEGFDFVCEEFVVMLEKCWCSVFGVRNLVVEAQNPFLDLRPFDM